MAASIPTCLACRTAFRSNNELVSLPAGRRIAFDPERSRVWRICTKCGEWNLLGVEAAGEALPELTARDPKPTTSVRSTRVSGDLELLRIEDLSKVEVGDLVMAEQRDALRRGAQLLPWLPVFFVILYLVPVSLGAVTGHGGAGSVMVSLLSLAAIYGLMEVRRIALRLRHGAPVSKMLWVRFLAPQAAYLLGLWAIGGSLYSAKFLYLGVLPTLALLSVVPWTRLFGRFLPRRFVDATLTDDWDAVAIRWTLAPPLITLRVLGEKWMDSDDSARVLETAVSAHALKRTNAAGVQHAHALAASLGAAGVLAALDAWRQDRDDTLTLGDLPAVYLVALQLAFSRQKEGSKKILAAHERLLEAAMVATEAEALDTRTG